MQINVHICPKCGWGYPNHHPSAKQRRAHKKVCGLVVLHESQDIQEHKIDDVDVDEETPLSVSEEEIRACLVDRQFSCKSEEDEYSDAKAEFTESDPRASNGAVALRVNCALDSKKLEAADLGQKVPVIDFEDTDEVCFSAGGIQVENNCASPSNVDNCVDCIDFNNVKQVDENLLVTLQPAYTSFEGLPEEIAKGCEEKVQVKLEVSPTTDTGELTTEMEAQNNSGHTHTGSASSDSDESANLKPLDTGDLKKSQQNEALGTRKMADNVSTGQEAAFSEVKDVSKGLELNETVSDPQDNCHDRSETSEKHEISNVENSVYGTDEVEFVDGDGTIQSFMEERKHEYPNEDEVNQKAVNNIIAEELMAPAVHSVPCAPTSSNMGESDVILGSGTDSDSGLGSGAESDSGAEDGKSPMAKQLQSMAVVLLDPVECPIDNVDDYLSSVTDSVSSPRHAVNCSSINAMETLPQSAPEALTKEVQVAESKDTSHFEVQHLSNTDTLTGSQSQALEAEDPVAESENTDIRAVHILPDTDLQAPKEEAQESKSKSTSSGEDPHLNGTDILVSETLQNTGYESPKEEAKVVESKSTAAPDTDTVLETDSQAQEVPKIEPIQSANAPTLKAALNQVSQEAKKNEEIIPEKATLGKLRAPLKSFLLEPNYETRQERKPDSSQYGTTPSSLPERRNIDKEWSSPARLPANNNVPKRKVRWTPFLCCLPVTTGRTSIVGTD
ncbi:hypothetical protein ACHQM5_028290 [Ranunculus cassubicifolius]